MTTLLNTADHRELDNKFHPEDEVIVDAQGYPESGANGVVTAQKGDCVFVRFGHTERVFLESELRHFEEGK